MKKKKQNIKVVDTEQKSEKLVQKLVTSILINLMQHGESFKVETNSFLMQYFVINSSSLQSKLQNNSIQFPSFCDLTKSINNCSQKNIIIMVDYYILKSFQ
jgi:hypothetical protein